ncbi:MAG: hypothetical protein Q3X95_06235 [Duodenibacillus sp.]|nr:hypothetical protein [Duodenibacillus sp.]
MAEVREVQQARAAAATLATMTGKPGQIIVDKDNWVPHIMDGATAGGHAVALKTSVDTLDGQAVKTVEQTLTDEQMEQALANLGVNAALDQLIEEYGGTVPAGKTMAAAEESADPWADFN